MSCPLCVPCYWQAHRDTAVINLWALCYDTLIHESSQSDGSSQKQEQTDAARKAGAKGLNLTLPHLSFGTLGKFLHVCLSFLICKTGNIEYFLELMVRIKWVYCFQSAPHGCSPLQALGNAVSSCRTVSTIILSNSLRLKKHPLLAGRYSPLLAGPYRFLKLGRNLCPVFYLHLSYSIYHLIPSVLGSVMFPIHFY